MRPYVALGLTALARNAELRGSSWFIGHIGAAVIAGAFLLENEKMSEEARSLLKAQLDKVIAENELFFVPFEEAEAAPLTGFLEVLQQNCSELSTAGHGVIYGTLALRALTVLPEMATAPLLQGLINTLESTQQDNPKRYFGFNDYREYESQMPELDLELALQRAYRMSCENIFDNQTVAGQYYFFAGEKLHGITHAQALLDLSLLGYPELAKKGLPGLNKQLELVEKRPEGLAVADDLSLNIFDQSFWSHGFEDLHGIKLAYSAAELNHAFGDEAIPLEKLHRHFAFLN